MGAVIICQPMEVPSLGGGGFRFLRAFEAWVTQRGHAITRDPAKPADVLLMNSWHLPPHFAHVARTANPAIRIVHRVDNAAVEYGRTDGVDAALTRLNRYATVTIHQSTYARYVLTTKHGLCQDGPILTNPVDLAAFTPDGPVRALPAWDGPKLIAVSWSPNVMKGGRALYEAAERAPDVQFVFAGRFNMPPRPNIVHLGVLGTEDLAAALRACDALVTFAENEACPNHVIEALACARPVIYRRSGALGELLEPAWSVEVAEPRDLVWAVDEARGLEPKRARAIAEMRHNPERVFAEYLNIMTGFVWPA